MSTSNHVLRVHRARLSAGTLGRGDVTEFGLADGLRGVEGVKRHRSAVSDSLGRIWLSLNSGISVADPARLTRSATAPALPKIQGISADGTSIPPGGPVSISPGRQRLVISYSGLILSLPDRVRFQYWLEGFDRGWSEPTGERQAVYTNLEPKEYRFHLRASGPEGLWSEREAELRLRVEPAFRQTPWFRAGVVSLLALAAIAAYQLRLRNFTRRLNLRFEERLMERTRIAQELHDTLLQGFLSASMQVHVVADGLPADSRFKPTLTRALELMRQVIGEGRNVVRGLRAQTGPDEGLEDAFVQLKEELALHESGGAAAFHVSANGDTVILHPVQRDEIFRIGKEALINAFRHAQARRIDMELHYETNLLRMVVRDDGRGIEAQTLDGGRAGHWGLSGMRERADRIGARLRIRSNVGAGTEIELTVAHQGRRKPESKPANESPSLVKEPAQ